MQVHSFLGAVTIYKSMFPRRSHVLRPLTELTGKGAFEWLPRHQKAFDEMKVIIAAEAINVYADPKLPFEIYTNASDYQMGAAIMQNGKYVAYWSRSLSPAQKNHNNRKRTQER